MIEPGDILLFKGTTPIISPVIRWFTDSNYTHAGLAISDEWIYEIDINRRLAIHPLREDQYDVFRYKDGLTEQQKSRLQIRAYERAKKNRGYDWWRVVGFALEKLFRFPFVFDEVNHEVCSEIIDILYHDLGIDLVPDREDGNVTPSHISTSPNVIKMFSQKA